MNTYEKHSWVAGDNVTPSKLNNIENGVKDNNTAILSANSILERFSNESGNVIYYYNIDANTLTKSGLYYANGANFPKANTSYYVVVIAYSTQRIVHMAFTNNTTECLIRYLNGTTWSSWQRLVTSNGDMDYETGNLTLLVSGTNYGNYEKIGKMVHIKGLFVINSEVSANTNIFTLPYSVRSGFGLFLRAKNGTQCCQCNLGGTALTVAEKLIATTYEIDTWYVTT